MLNHFVTALNQHLHKPGGELGPIRNNILKSKLEI